MDDEELDALENSLIPESDKVVDDTPDEPSDVAEDIVKVINGKQALLSRKFGYNLN